MIVYDCEQRGAEWHALRCGRVTGSCADAIIAERKRGTGELAIRRDLRQRLVVERLTGIAADDIPYKGKDLQHGIDCEPQAFAAYEAIKGEIATRVGFVAHDTLMAGCSPDGVVGDWRGCIELKCPASSTHLEYIKAGLLPAEYYAQCLHTLWITGAPWVDFCSFDPRYPEHLQLFVKRLERNADLLKAYELAVMLFLDEVDKEVAVLRGEAA